MNDTPGGVCDYCNADEGRCWDDCPTVKIKQQSDEIKRLRKVLEHVSCMCLGQCVHGVKDRERCIRYTARSALQKKGP